ncbi:MAG: TraB/GumN family protein [Boseongicola sp.]
MLRLLKLLAVAVITPLAAFAQSCGTADLIAALDGEDRARLDALVAPHVFPTGNLWRAEKDDKTVIVAGTLHIPDPRLAPMVESIRPHLESADLLILEATSEDEATLAGLAASKPDFFFITEGPTLIDLLGSEDWGRVEAQLNALGIPGFLGAKFQPWYMNLTLAIPPCALALIQSGEKGFDRQLEDIALASGVTLASLDDAEAVLSLFADEPIEDQLDGLRITLNTQQDGDANTSTLIEAYFDGRTREGWEYARILIENAGIENGAELFEEINQQLLVGRNQSWEPNIVSLVAGKNAVLAVGAAHLSGESGVLRALERAGYVIEEF